LLADMLLTAGRLRRHLAGQPLDDRYVEELIGKTWRKKERPPIAGLELCEYAYTQRITSDDYEIRESRFIDLGSGEHYSEKQILPRFLARRTRAKRSHRGLILRGAAGTLYPGFAPRRLELTSGTPAALGDAELARLVACASPDVAAAVDRFRQHRRDPFAPDRLPLALRAHGLLASGRRLQVFDATGAALYLPADQELSEELAHLLARAPLLALIGEVYAEVILPTLVPLAAVVRGPNTLELWPLPPAAANLGAPGSWADVARSAGLSRVAISLGEVREELAQAFVAGVAGFGPRAAEPLAVRLADLGLSQAPGLLERIAASADPSDRVPEFVKLFHLLELAMLHVAGAATVAREQLRSVPGWHGVFAPCPATTRPPAELWELLRQQQMSELEAALHLSFYIDKLTNDELCDDLALWASAGAAPHIAAALAARGGGAARGGVARALELSERGSAVGRTAVLTSLAVLEALAPSDPAVASSLLSAAQSARTQPDGSALAGLIVDALARLQPRGDAAHLVALQADLLRKELPDGLAALAGSADKDERVAAAYLLGACGARAAIPGLRAAFRRDPSRDVRDRAALSLAQLGDGALTIPLLAALEGGDDRAARVAVHALGWLADARALPALLAAAARGFKPVLLTAAIGRAPALVLEPLLDLFAAEPGLARRKGLVSAAAGQDPARVATALLRRIEAAPLGPLAECAPAYLTVAEAAGVAPQIATKLLVRLAGVEGPTAARACRAARRFLAP
jgi:HEAT repeat protein